MTLAEMLSRAEQLALASGDAHQSPVVDAGMTAETILPHVFHYIVDRSIHDPQRQHLFRRTKTLTFTNGVASLSSDVMTEALPDAVLTDANDPSLSPNMSWVPYWFDFVRPLRTMIGSYTINEYGQLAIRRPGEIYVPNGGFNGQLSLTIPCVPAMVDPVAAPDEVIDEIIAGVAGALRGDTAWTAIVMEALK